MTDKEFENIACEMREAALRTARSFPLPTDDAEDVAQEVMLRLWAMHERVGKEDRVGAMVSIMARNACIDHLRKRHHEAILNEDIGAMTEVNQQDELEYRELKEWIDEQIDQLPSTNATILRMRQIELREIDEIASLLGLTTSSVKTLLSRARRQLLERIRQDRQFGIGTRRE